MSEAQAPPRHAPARPESESRQKTGPVRTGPVTKRIVSEDLEAVHEVLDAGLAVGGLILVDNALGNGLVELTVGGRGSSLVASLDGGLDVLDHGLELGADRLVTDASDLVGADALLLGLDVCYRVRFLSGTYKVLLSGL